MKRLALNQYPANARAIPNRVFRQPSYTRKSFQVKAARLPHTSSTHSEGSRASFSSEVPLQFPEAVNSGSFALTAAGGAGAGAAGAAPTRKSLRIRPSVSGVQSFASSAPLRSMTATSVAPQSATQLPSLPAPQYLEPVAPRRRRNKRSSRNKRSRSKRSSSSRSKRSSRRQLV